MGGKRKSMSETRAPVKPEALELNAVQTPAVDPLPRKERPLEAAVRAALRAENIRDARTLVSNAEAILAGHAPSQSPRMEPSSRSQIAAAKARIAIATGDGAAARAILVQAIEADPNTKTLKTLMTEVMMADGRATDVRPVLKHLGNDARTEEVASDDNGSSVRDTSG